MQGDVTWRMFKQLTCSTAHYFVIWGEKNHNQSMSTTWTYFLPSIWFCRTMTDYPITVSILQFIVITTYSIFMHFNHTMKDLLWSTKCNKYPSWKSKYVKFNVKILQQRYANSWFTCLTLKDSFSTNLSKIYWIFPFYLCIACGKQDFIRVWN